MQIINLNTLDLIAIEGIEAKKFLQGQVTCDVEKLSPSHSIEGAICNIKGRVIGDFRLVEFQEICYLQLAAGMADIVKPVLDKYMVFSKAESRLANSEIRRMGIIVERDSTALQTRFGKLPDEDGESVIKDHSILIKVPGLLHRYELWQFNTQDTEEDQLLNQLMESAKTGLTESWQLEDIRAGIVHITPSISEQQLPEALNYDLSGVISFTKGCYTGQEIVARMHYRGTAKKRLFSGYIDGSARQPESIDCIAPEQQTAVAGQILNSARDESGKWFVLAILPSAAQEIGAEVYINENPELSVELISLPYVAD